MSRTARRGWPGEAESDSRSRSIVWRFPGNVYVQCLVGAALARRIRFEPSPIPEQWMYHPGRRAIMAWLPDLEEQSISYLVMIMAHELGHAIDFEHRPGVTRTLFTEWPPGPAEEEAELHAFIEAFLLLKELSIPVSLSQFVAMIASPMSEVVEQRLSGMLCCLLDRPAGLGEGAAGPSSATA